MKKILALLLIVSCVFALGSCKLINKIKNKGNDDGPGFDTDAVAAVQAKIDASVPQSANVTVTLKSVYGNVNGEYDVTYNADGSATVVYCYEKLNSFNADDPADDYKSSYSGTTTVGADGTVTDELGGTASVEAITFDINLDSSKLESATVQGSILNATVKAENTAAVLGVNIGADVNIVISTASVGVASVAISYTSSAGVVEISATYTYAPVAEGTN